MPRWAHNWLALRPPITRLQNVCHRSGANTSFADGRLWTSDVPLARFDPSCCWTLIAPPIPTCNFPFTFTHDSRVMSTICQSPRACRDDFQQLLPSRMDWCRLFQPTWNEPSIRWNKVSARSHKQKKGNTNIQLSIAFIGLMTGCNLTPAKNSLSITNCNSIINRHECHQVLTTLMPLSCHGQSQQRG